MRIGGVDRCAEVAVLTLEISFRDPTGPAAEASNGDAHVAGKQKLGEFGQRWDAHAVDLRGDAVFDEWRSLAHQDDACFMARVEGAFGHEERKRRPGRVFGTRSTDVEKLRHELPP